MPLQFEQTNFKSIDRICINSHKIKYNIHITSKRIKNKPSFTMLMRKTTLIALMIINTASAVLGECQVEGYFPTEQDAYTSTDCMNVRGGRCRNAIDGGRYYKQVIVKKNLLALGINTEDELESFTQDDKIDGCAKLCDLEGGACKGFDYRKNRESGPRPTTDCYFNSNYPTYSSANTSRNNYEDWLCFTNNDSPVRSLCDELDRIRQVCLNRDDVCEAKANLKKAGNESCDSWCGRSGLVCDGAWNDKNGCGKRSPIECSATGKGASICRCKNP